VVYDVPRGPEEKDLEHPERIPKRKAIIADPRNDQTLILVQLHVAMQRFHNKLVDYMRALKVPRASVFESARRMARWHYQWIVIHEFLPAIAGSMASAVYQETSRAPRIDLRFYKPTNTEQRPFIPVEFSVAAYRFGHSIARPRYTVRDYTTSSGASVGVSSVPLMAAELTYQNFENVLNGSRPIPARLKLQWSKFFNKPGDPRTARPVRQFDASLSDVLFSMPPTALPDSVSGENLLAVRNLNRGRIVGLPSGEQVARLMGVAPLTKAQLSSNRRIEIAWPITNNTVVAEEVTVEENPKLKEVFDHENWPGETPLWFYILKEAEILGRGETLGPVGGRIVAEVLVGLLQRDLNSYLYLDPKWKPTTPIAPAYGKFTMADLLKFTGIWS
jgi:Animal haem peroxidase